MPIEWSDYDGFDWARSQQRPMSAAERGTTEVWLADLLELDAQQQSRPWGFASPPGRFAATVVRLAPGLRHAFADATRSAGLASMGVKIFKPGAKAAGSSALALHRDRWHRLGDLSAVALQRLVGAGESLGQYYTLVEWVAGVTLEARVLETLSIELRRALVQQILGSIVIPLWSRGLVFWDIRPANFVVEQGSNHLVMIDVDSLAGAIAEMLERPTDWTKREKWRATGLRRLRNLARKLQPARRFEAAWALHLEPALRVLREPADRKAAERALAAFMADLEDACGNALAMEQP